jgi:hypothetical protein
MTPIMPHVFACARSGLRSEACWGPREDVSSQHTSGNARAGQLCRGAVVGAEGCLVLCGGHFPSSVWVFVCCFCLAAAAPRTTYRPVVLMHGLGDAGSNPGMQSLAQSVMTKYPGSYAVGQGGGGGWGSHVGCRSW